MPETEQGLKVRVVEPGRGWQWLVAGFALFRRSPAVWIALTLLAALLWLVSLAIPVVGPLLFNLLSPALFAGLMIGCRALEKGEPLAIPHLFAAFRQHAAPLVTVGGVYLVGTIIVVGIMLAVAGDSMPAALPKTGGDIEEFRAKARGMAFAFAVGAAVYLPLLMLVWFAPPLVVFDGLAPVAAMGVSFVACFQNVLPFLVYGAAVLALWVALSVPAALGAAGAGLAVALLVVSIPVLICSVYAGYKDIFVATPGPATGNDSFPG